MLDYYVDIAADEDAGMWEGTAHFCLTSQTMVSVRMGDQKITLSKPQLEKLLFEYDRFLSACKCVEARDEPTL